MVFLCFKCTHSFLIRLFSIIIPMFFLYKSGRTAAGVCTFVGAWALCGGDINCTVYDGLMSESIHAYIIYTHVFLFVCLFGD